MRIAMIGTRGVPARYGGFETAVEEVGLRLVRKGHEVTVYCRGDDQTTYYLGMRRVVLPAVRSAIFETLSHSALSVVHAVRQKPECAIIFNAANAPFIPLLHFAGIPAAVHVDGLEWQRAKWGPVGRRYYLMNERFAARHAKLLIADAVGIQDYYLERYRVDSEYIPYGAPILSEPDLSALSEQGLTPRRFHLVVARMEPENHIDLILRGYIQSTAQYPIVIVGSVPYASEHSEQVKQLAHSDSRVRLVGSIWDQSLLNALYASCASYIHGHSVGGTNPSLLRAMGAAADTIAWDVVFNREVLGECGHYFTSPNALAKLIEEVEADGENALLVGHLAQRRAGERYTWESVADQYEHLCEKLSGMSYSERA